MSYVQNIKIIDVIFKMTEKQCMEFSKSMALLGKSLSQIKKKISEDFKAPVVDFPDDDFNLDNPDDTLTECYRVAKPHARIAITTNLDGHMQEFYTAFETVLCDTGHDNLMDVLNGHRARRGTVASHRALLERNGFKVQKQIDLKMIMFQFLN